MYVCDMRSWLCVIYMYFVIPFRHSAKVLQKSHYYYHFSFVLSVSKLHAPNTSRPKTYNDCEPRPLNPNNKYDLYPFHSHWFQSRRQESNHEGENDVCVIAYESELPIAVWVLACCRCCCVTSVPSCPTPAMVLVLVLVLALMVGFLAPTLKPVTMKWMVV